MKYGDLELSRALLTWVMGEKTTCAMTYQWQCTSTAGFCICNLAAKVGSNLNLPSIEKLIWYLHLLVPYELAHALT